MFGALIPLPMDKSTLCVHQVKFMIKPNRCNSRWLVVYADLKSTEASVNKLEAYPSVNSSCRRIDILRRNITTIKKATFHIFSKILIIFYDLI